MRNKRTQCPDCLEEGKTKFNVGVYGDGLWCFRCEKFIMSDNVQTNKQKLTYENSFISDITSKKISSETLSYFNVEMLKNIIYTSTTGNSGSIQLALKFPYSEDNSVVKLKTPEKQYTWINHTKNLPMFGANLHDSSRKNIIITEGEEDCMAVWQVLGHGSTRSLNHVTRLHNGAGSAAEFVKQHYEKYALEGDLVEQIKYSLNNELVSSDIVGTSAPAIFDSMRLS